MGLISVEGIRVFAYHGHLPEEAVLGGHFIVNVWVTADTSEVEKTDDLNDTVDYVSIIEIVKEQMEIRADMIEVTAIADMDANDTAFCNIFQNGGTSQTDINAYNSAFYGYLLG